MEKPLSETEAASTFERFKDLTRKLIAVPKEELNQRLAEEKARKATPLNDPKTA